MPGQIETALMPRDADAAIERYLRVKEGASPGVTVQVSGDETGDIGVTQNRAYKAGDKLTIRDVRDPGTFIMVANGAISVGGTVYAAAGGKVAGSGTNAVGTAISAAAADGEHLEVLLSL